MIPLLVLSAAGQSTQGQYTAQLNSSSPQLPQRWIASTINAANFPGLFSSPVIKTVRASGGNYTSIQAALNNIGTDAPNCNEIIQIDSESTGFVTNLPANPASGYAIQFTYRCPLGNYVWLRPSAWASLPAQDSDTQTCNVNGTNHPCALGNSSAVRQNMFKIVKTASTNVNLFDTAMLICDNAGTSSCSPIPPSSARGYIITGMDFELASGFLFNAILVGRTANPTVSNIYFDRDSWDTTCNCYSASTIIYSYINNYASWISVTDNYFNHIWLPNNQYGNLGGTQTQCFVTASGGDPPYPGPYKLVNNACGGDTTENMMFGGGGIINGCSSDIEVRRNLNWKDTVNFNNGGTGAVISNLFEEKGCAQRTLLEANYLLYNFSDAPTYDGFGDMVSFKEDQNANGLVPALLTHVTSDIEMRYNVACFGVGIGAWIGYPSYNYNGNNPATPTWPVQHNTHVHDNLFCGMSYATYGSGGGEPQKGMTLSTGNNWSFFPPPNANTLGYNFPGPLNMGIYNNDVFGLPSNGSFIAYLDNPGPPHVGCPHTSGTVVPGFIFRNNAYVLDGTSWAGDCGVSTDFATSVGPFFYQLKTGGNVLFNWNHTGSQTCSNWQAYNPGICPAGTASTPATINSTLHIADYANCSAGNNIFTTCLKSAPPTGLTNIPGPNYAAMQAAMSICADCGYGPRRTH